MTSITPRLSIQPWNNLKERSVLVVGGEEFALPARALYIKCPQHFFYIDWPLSRFCGGGLLYQLPIIQSELLIRHNVNQ